MSAPFYNTVAISSTDASHSQIGTATPLDYNLSSIQKNSVVVVNVTVSISAPGEPREQKQNDAPITPVPHADDAPISAN